MSNDDDKNLIFYFKKKKKESRYFNINKHDNNNGKILPVLF